MAHDVFCYLKCTTTYKNLIKLVKANAMFTPLIWAISPCDWFTELAGTTQIRAFLLFSNDDNTPRYHWVTRSTPENK